MEGSRASLRRPFLAIVVVIALSGVAWAAACVVPPRVRGEGDFEPATREDCQLIGRAVQSRELARATERWEPSSLSEIAALPVLVHGRLGLCASWGKERGLVTRDELRIETDPRRTAFVTFAHPRYSLLRTRVIVDVQIAKGFDDSTGYACEFRRAPSGWVLKGCTSTWIS